MPRGSNSNSRKRARKAEYLNSENAAKVANAGMNPAFTQTQGQPYKDPATGKWKQGDMVTQTKQGRMSTNGRTAGGKTWTMTPKNDDGSPVLGKNGQPRQSGRSQIASRRQRDYDIRKGLQNAWQDSNGMWHNGPAPEGAAVGADNAARVTTG